MGERNDRKSKEKQQNTIELCKRHTRKNKKRDEKTYIYIEGEKKAIEVVWDLFILVWKRDIYQKAPEMDLTF